MAEELLDYSSDSLTPLDIWVKDKHTSESGKQPEKTIPPTMQVVELSTLIEDMEVSLQGLGFS